LKHAKKMPKSKTSSARGRSPSVACSRVPFHKEAEQIVHAIRRGKVDALVMDGSHGETVVTLQGADHPYRVLVESINDGAATLDASGMVLYANNRFAEILDLPVEKLIGASLESCLPVSQHTKLRELIARARKRSHGLELTLNGFAGRSKLVRFTIKPLKGVVHKICVVATELTELVEANEALKSNEESLRQLSARLLQLQDEERRHIARDLHDVTGQKLAFQCMALSGILAKHSQNMDSETQQSLSESLHLNKEVSAEIRTLSYLLHPPLLDELGLSSAARWYAAGFTKRTGIPIDVDVPTELKRLSPDAEVAIFRVLQESLTNVHRYANTSKARLSIHSTVDEIHLEVQDFGKGIQGAKSKSAQQSIERLGIGIQGMTERIRQLGGRLEITSSADRGTLVSATIPLSAPRVAISSQAPSSNAASPMFIQPEDSGPPQANHRKRILIADDHAMLRRGVRNTLQTEPDLEICGEAVDGQDTVDKVKELRPDLVILDINMPMLNGLAAVRQILRHRPETKVVVFSVHNSDQTVHEISAAGAHGFISKGKDAQELLRVVRDVLKEKTHATRGASGSVH
jgi:two-component system, NarL family, sensor kinase